MITIPLPIGQAFFDQRVELGERSYVLNFAWNARAGYWALDLSDADGVELVTGIALVTNRLLLRRYKADPRLPEGDLFMLDLTETIAAAGFDQLGTDVELLYLEPEDLADG